MNSASGQEVIDRSPQEFKIACLSALASLFSSSSCPYYAGKGKATTTFISVVVQLAFYLQNLAKKPLLFR
jgi:phosphatidate phosphatase PAH1